MEIRHFRYFLSVARLGHFTRAAEQLGIAPPTLSRQIQDMERQLGVRLFERSQREVCLTAAGEALLPEAEQAVRQFDAAQLGAQRAGRGDVGRIELGYVASAAFSGLLQQQVTRFSQSHPGVVLNIREQPMAESPALVRDGVLDIAYVRTPMDLPDELVAMDLHEEGFVLALPASSRLNELPQIMAARLATETFILPEQISGTLAVAAQGGFVPRLGPQPGSLVAVITLVSLGQGVALVPESVLQHITLPQVSYRRIADSQPTSCLTVLHRRFEKAPAVMRYIEALRTGQG
ncbi:MULTISPECIES: LysR family transcriptional regulator [Pseudomonas]|jgi:DNA-binding transcriptional LysR family regulator|uniref:LysR family transcriptional regulator n=2 Tax=Pseudomonas TaxID=286 RepID=A0A9X8EDY6_PSEPU|nr:MULTISPECIES: LysR family transcriptional regulator [Pseudomonas]MCO7506957.1 LysR family transcriptional regulator [Pseudomonas sp. VE 267-6A]MCO7529966.1 LysR family transcriptional regulator [Pseudomonas sp. 2]MDD1957720.1 LysR family transcriptional regulator [Pseudomonas sp. 8209]QVL20712.1 LysR family transcriptional regulator [Pseudomonas qingdaonensis]ROQ43088.1 LysR family transcriptional regulator [Pseudomonas putida]